MFPESFSYKQRFLDSQSAPAPVSAPAPGAPGASTVPGPPAFFSQCIIENRGIARDEDKIGKLVTVDSDQCEKACSDRGTECVGWTWSSEGCDLFHNLLMEQEWSKITTVTSGLMNYQDCPIWAKTTTKGEFKDPDAEKIKKDYIERQKS